MTIKSRIAPNVTEYTTNFSFPKGVNIWIPVMLDNPIKRIVGVIICIASVAPIKSSPDKTINVSFANKIKKIVDEKLPLNLAIIKFCLHSNASDVIVPVWDLLEVDNEQRFNIPGEVNDTNWTYRVSNMSLVEKAFKLFNKLKSED